MKQFSLIEKVIDRSILFLFDWLQKNSLNSIHKDTNNPARVQKKVLKRILKLQKDTEYGKKYNFNNIESIEDFKAKNPLTNYEDYRFLLEDIAKNGKSDLLLAEPIILLQETSGTTGKTKLIPRTKSLLSTFQKSFLVSAALANSYCFAGERINKKKSCIGMAVSNASSLKYTPSGIPRGTGSSGGIKQAPYLLKKIFELNFSSPFSVFTIQDYKSAYYCHLLFALLNRDLAYISANFAANVLEAMQILEGEWQQLLQDIDRGKISEKLKLDPSVRSQLEDLLKPNPNRYRELKIEFEKGLENIIPRIWPKLAYIGCITTGSMEIYKERLKFYAGKVPLYSDSYGASESWIGLNLESEKDRSIYTITPHAAFFEFIPVAEIDAKNPTTIELTSLEINKIYEIVLTTVAGLYKYRLGDIVKCVGYYNKTPKIEYLYRRGSLLNLKGEKVSEDTVYTAITEATKSLANNCKIQDYTTIMDYTYSTLEICFLPGN